MKKLIIFSFFSLGMCFTCLAQQKKTNTAYVSYSDEPTYKLDRRLAAAQTATTDNNGASGPGTGGTYGATYYRSMAYKNAALQAKQRNSVLAVKQK